MCYGWGSLNGIISSSHYSIKFCQNNKLELLQYISYISIYFDIFFGGGPTNEEKHPELPISGHHRSTLFLLRSPIRLTNPVSELPSAVGRFFGTVKILGGFEDFLGGQTNGTDSCAQTGRVFLEIWHWKLYMYIIYVCIIAGSADSLTNSETIANR